jgi:hypothetical protein
MKPLVNPVLNLNGNSADSLLEPLMEVLNRINALEVALAEASDVCHGRNFQTVADDHLLVEARQAWGQRRVMLVDLEHEITNMALDIQRQKRERERA